MLDVWDRGAEFLAEGGHALFDFGADGGVIVATGGVDADICYSLIEVTAFGLSGGIALTVVRFDLPGWIAVGEIGWCDRSHKGPARCPGDGPGP